MKMSEEERQALVKRRIERAYETWEETKGIVKDEFWLAAANRMYYTCYYLVTALLLSRSIEANTHTGVIRMFGMQFVSKGLISDEMGRYYSRLFDIRQSGDYDDWKMISAGDILPLFKQIRTFFDAVEPLINNK